MGVSKFIQLPAPVQRRPATERLGLFNLTINPFARSGSATFAAADEHGNLVAGGDVISFGVSGADYDAAVDPLVTTVMTQLLVLLKVSGQVDSASTLENAQPEE